MGRSNCIKHLLVCFWVLVSGIHVANAQDEDLKRLPFQPQFSKQVELSKSGAKNGNDKNFLYLLDTLSLPFVDDFSGNTIKPFTRDTSDAAVTRVVYNKFIFNGLTPDTVAITQIPQYSYFQPADTNRRPDSVLLPQVTVNFYNPAYPFGLDSSLTGWTTGFEIPGLIDFIDTLSITVDTVDLDSGFFDTTYVLDITYVDPTARLFTNFTKVYFVVEDDDFSLWTGSNTLINNGFPIDPPSIGVATFDGMDSSGFAHDFSVSTTFGRADELTSKPLDLSPHSPGDSVLLSFFYQSKGFGNIPEDKDSIVLQFYAPLEDTWYSVWNNGGNKPEQFEEVYVTVSQGRFLLRGFKFRFFNYSTLSGILDTWNIDYVRMNTNRTRNEEILDVAFLKHPSSWLVDYTAMPWEHYQSDPASFMLDTVQLNIGNLRDSLAVFITNVATTITDETNSTQNLTDYAVSSFGAGPGIVRVTDPANGYSFPTTATGDSTFFKIFHDIDVSPDALVTNDTITYFQRFNTWYSYDDGSAEAGYGLEGDGASMAMQFTAAISDTLKAVDIYFPQHLENAQNRSFRIIVWEDSNGEPGNEIFRSFLREPVYNANYQFQRYDLEDTALVISGTFHVGIEQVLSGRIYVGFDENNNQGNKIHFNLGLGWTDTQFTGSLMIRPDFGEEPLIASIGDYTPRPTVQIGLYPNPGSGTIYLNHNLQQPVNLMVFDLNGRLVTSERNLTTNRFDVSALHPGIYLVAISDPKGHWGTTKKLVVHR